MFIGIDLDLNRKTEEQVEGFRYSRMVRRVERHDNMVIWEPMSENYLNIQMLRLNLERVGFYQATEIKHILEKTELIW